MTGFARVEGRAEEPEAFSWVWEAKSVNSRGLDVRTRLPHGFEALEGPVRSAAAKAFSRGALTLWLTVASDSAGDNAGVGEAALDALIQLARRKYSEQGPSSSDNAIAPARLDGLMAMAQGKETQDNLDPERRERRDGALLAGLDQALDVLTQVRRQEGAELAPVVSAHLDSIAGLSDQAGRLADTQPEAIQARLTAQLEELSQSVPAVSEEKLAQEVALLALKGDVREELDRLKAHVVQARELLSKGEPCGRRLDFLSQEFNREANTLCSKSTSIELTQIGLELKSTIDQFREQIQNIE